MNIAAQKTLLCCRDSALTHEIVEALGGQDCARREVVVAVDEDTAKQRIVQDIPDVVLVDLAALKEPKLEALRELRRAVSYAPLVVNFPAIEPRGYAELFGAGADYVVGDVLNPWEAAVSNAEEQWNIRAVQNERIVSLEHGRMQLERQVERLQRLSETAYRFVDTVSHEFRTPLTVINDFATIVRDELAGEVNEQQREHLNVITQRVEDLTAVVNDMFEMSQLEAGLLAMKRHVCRATDILQAVLPTLEHRTSRKEVQLLVDVPPELPDVFCDPEKVRRILVNLVDDALAALVAGGRIELKIRHIPDTGQVEFEVADDGPGKDADALEAIREHFAEMDPDVKCNPKRLDLGLSIAKELVHLNLGRIEVDSQQGRGTTYRFTLPTADFHQISKRYLDNLRQLGRPDMAASLIQVAAPADTVAALVDEVDDFLCRTVRCTDLLFRVDPRSWLLLSSGEQHDANRVMNEIERERKQANRNRPGARLPLLKMTVNDRWDLEPDDPSQPTADPASPPGARRVLLVDDDRDIVEGAAIRLQTCGFEVFTAYDGNRALEVASRETLDAILLDVRMPGLDGLGVLRQLREQPTTADVPVAIMSGAVGDKDTALQSGAQYFLTKPYRAAELMEAVEFMSTAAAGT